MSRSGRMQDTVDAGPWIVWTVLITYTLIGLHRETDGTADVTTFDTEPP